MPSRASANGTARQNPRLVGKQIGLIGVAVGAFFRFKLVFDGKIIAWNCRPDVAQADQGAHVSPAFERRGKLFAKDPFAPGVFYCRVVRMVRGYERHVLARGPQKNRHETRNDRQAAQRCVFVFESQKNNGAGRSVERPIALAQEVDFPWGKKVLVSGAELRPTGKFCPKDMIEYAGNHCFVCFRTAKRLTE